LRSVSFRVPDDGARGARTSQGDIEVLRPLVAATAQKRSNEGGGTVTNLVDLESIPPIDLFGEAVRARRVQGDNLTLAIVELAPDAIVPEHRHPNEQLGMVISGDVTFTLDGETRHLGPGGTWRILSMKPHEVHAGPTGAVVIDVFAPVRDDWDSKPRLEPRAPAWPTGS